MDGGRSLIVIPGIYSFFFFYLSRFNFCLPFVVVVFPLDWLVDWRVGNGRER